MWRRTKVKICGITRVEDARLAGELGVDAVGVNFHPPSPRWVDADRARQLVAAVPPAVETVGLFVDRPAGEILAVLAETGIATVQLHGSEPPRRVAERAPHRVLRAFRWQGESTAVEIAAYLAECGRLAAMPVGLLIDAHHPDARGGTGRTWDWGQAASLAAEQERTLPLVLAGGLTPENVGRAIETLRPYAVDVASGVESEPGVKDPDKLRAFFEAVRNADR